MPESPFPMLSSPDRPAVPSAPDRPTMIGTPDTAPSREPVMEKPPAPVTPLLVTGAGGPSAIGFLTLATRPDVVMFAADADPYASGLFLVPPSHRIVVPRGDDPAFVDVLLAVCRRERIAVVVPTVDAELIPLADRAAEFAAIGTRILAPGPVPLRACLDKAHLATLCRMNAVPVPRTEVIGSATVIPVGSIVKPRTGSGSRGVRLIDEVSDAATVPRDGSHIVQERLPGEELSVDVYVRADGAVVAAVPRSRDRIDSGIAVAGRTRDDAEAIAIAIGAVRATGLRGVANVQLKRNPAGRLMLLEINPRLPGSLVLTAAAGANLAALALAEALGEAVPDTVPFREVGVVRYLTEVLVELDQYPADVSEERAA